MGNHTYRPVAALLLTLLGCAENTVRSKTPPTEGLSCGTSESPAPLKRAGAIFEWGCRPRCPAATEYGLAQQGGSEVPLCIRCPRGEHHVGVDDHCTPDAPVAATDSGTVRPNLEEARQPPAPPKGPPGAESDASKAAWERARQSDSTSRQEAREREEVVIAQADRDLAALEKQSNPWGEAERNTLLSTADQLGKIVERRDAAREDRGSAIVGLAQRWKKLEARLRSHDEQAARKRAKEDAEREARKTPAERARDRCGALCNEASGLCSMGCELFDQPCRLKCAEKLATCLAGCERP